MGTVLIFIIVLGILVLVHEFGHFIVARKSGIKVYEFGIGFPPRLFGWYRDPATKKLKVVWGSGKNGLKKTVVGDEPIEQFPDTIYSLNILPLGGFVKIKGENGENAQEADSFGFQKAWKRIAVLSAGVIMNVLFAAIVLSIGFMIGLPADFSEGTDPKAVVVEEPRIAVQMVERGSPAEEAGIMFGDIVTAVNGVEFRSSEELIAYIKDQGNQELSVMVEREGEQLSFTMTPTILRNMDDSRRIGVMLADAGVVRYPWYTAIGKGFAAAFVGIINIFIAFFLLIKNLIMGNGLLFDISGPVGIASLVGQSARLGISYLLNVTAMISLSLAAINILPIPALDGGRILFVLIEKFSGKPVPMRYEQLAHSIGFILLMILIVVVTFRDVAGLL